MKLNEGEEVVFNSFSSSLPTFNAVETSQRNGVLTITAYDKLNNVNIPFDYTGYTQFDEHDAVKWYPTSQIVGAVASQCGLIGASFSPSRMSELCYQDFAGKSCGEILTEISRAEVGYWYQTYNDRLAFRPFSPSDTGIEISAEDRAEIVLDGTKAIKGIYAEDTVYGTEYGTSAPWQNTEVLKGRYLTQEMAESMTSQIIGSRGQYDYHGWSCSDMLVSGIYDIGDYIGYNGYALPILNADYRFTELGIIAAFSAPKADTSYAGYTDIYQRMLSGAIPYDRSLGMQYFNKNSSGFRIEV